MSSRKHSTKPRSKKGFQPTIPVLTPPPKGSLQTRSKASVTFGSLSLELQKYDINLVFPRRRWRETDSIPHTGLILHVIHFNFLIWYPVLPVNVSYHVRFGLNVFVENDVKSPWAVHVIKVRVTGWAILQDPRGITEARSNLKITWEGKACNKGMTLLPFIVSCSYPVLRLNHSTGVDLIEISNR